MFNRRFVSWQFHGGWDVFFVFVGLYSRTWKWYPRSLCTRGWWLQSNRFFYHLLLSKKCHMSPTDYSQGTCVGCDRRWKWKLQVRLVILSTFSLMERSDCVVKVMRFVSSITMCIIKCDSGNFPTKKIRRSTKSPCAVFMTENDGKNGLPGWFMTLLLSSDPALKHLPQNQTKWYDMNNIRSVHRVCTCMYSICFYLCMYLHRNHFSHDSCFFLMEFSSLSMCWDLILTVVVCMISSKDLCVFVAQESLSGPEHRTRFKWSSMATP